MNVLVFEDQEVDQLRPLTLPRPAYSISCASFRLIDWLLEDASCLVGWVRPHLEALQPLDYPGLAERLDPAHQWTLVVNARLVPAIDNVHRMRSLGSMPLNQPMRAQGVWSGESLAAAVLPTDALGTLQGDRVAGLHALAADLPSPAEVSLRLFNYPHEVIVENGAVFAANLDHRIQTGSYQNYPRHSGVYLGKNVQLSSEVVFDTSAGPVVIDDRVQVGPFTYFRGPVYVGPGSRISEHASIKDRVAVGHTCKIGGEVEDTILEPYSNKQHHGFLGHSYLGSWINLGAGTCNSDLKNTYGTVNMDYSCGRVSTGQQFVGCVVGDYAKTAINTSIFTGKVIGVASMVYGFATTNVPSFMNYARTFGEFGTLPPEVIVTTQRRMFARRNVVQRASDIQLLHDMFELTAGERPEGLSGDPLAL